MYDEEFKYGMGWIKDDPFYYEDISIENEDVMSAAMQIGCKFNIQASTMPNKVDLRQQCPPIFNQHRTSSCVANALSTALTYTRMNSVKDEEKLNKAAIIQYSRMFIYDNARYFSTKKDDLQDTGTQIRNAVFSIKACGACYSDMYPFKPEKINSQPPAYIYGFARQLRDVEFARLDTNKKGTLLDREKLLHVIKETLYNKLIVVFGAYLPISVNYEMSHKRGYIPFPDGKEIFIGGHAMALVGYDDSFIIEHPVSKKKTEGAFILQNSWGSEWGEAGYGFMPYEYITESSGRLGSYANDFWAVLGIQEIDRRRFE